MTAKDMARDERIELAAFLDTLTPAQWEGPTLCAGWRVHDVVAHMVSYDELDAVGIVRRFLRGRLKVDRINAVGVTAYAGRDPQALVALLRRHAWPHGVTAAFGGRVGLIDGLVHHQDIRRPLGLPRDIPAPRLRTALEFALFAPPIGGSRRVRGLRLVATDLDWSSGRGEVVEGPAEALLMAAAGRPGAADDLSGPGQPVLAARARHPG